MTTALTNCGSCGAPLNRDASACDKCGTPIIKSGGEQTSQAVHNIAATGTKMKSTTAAMWVNLSIALGFACICAWPIIPIIVYFCKKDDPFVLAHLKSTTNFAITMCIAGFVAGILMIILIGYVLLIAIVAIQIIFGIKGAMAASRGELYTYPLSIKIWT